MVKTIEISDELYDRLGSMAKGFGDTAENVIERLVENETRTDIPPRAAGIYSHVQNYGGKDTTKYMFNGKRYGKGRLALAVVTEYVKQNPNTTFIELEKVFPPSIQGGSIGTIAEIQAVNERAKSLTGDLKRRYYFGTRPGAVEPIEISDCTIVVTNQWGIGNIGKMLNKAEKLGYEITAV